MNKTQIYEQLNSIFASRRTAAQTQAFANVKKARQHPDFNKTVQNIKVLSFDLGKATANGNVKLAKELNAKLIEQKVIAEQILVSLGLCKKDLEPQYSCTKCNDTGKVKGQPCDCYKKELYNLLLNSCGGKKELATFDAFNEKLITNPAQKQQLQKTRDLLSQWAEKYPAVKSHTFLICGKTGVGKTFITECLASAMINRGFLVSFISGFGLNNTFIKYHTTFDETKTNYYDALLDPELLIIDDLGTEQITKNVTIPYLTALLNDRYNQKKSTIITTNLSLEEINARYGERIFSRISNKMDSTLINIEGDDLRFKKRQN